MKKVFHFISITLLSLSLGITPVIAKTNGQSINKDVQAREILRSTARCLEQIGPYTVYIDVVYTYRYDATVKANVITGIQGGNVINLRGFKQIKNVKIPNGTVTYSGNNTVAKVPVSFYGVSETEARTYTGTTAFKAN